MELRFFKSHYIHYNHYSNLYVVFDNRCSISKVDWSWLAGFLDGDGCISIYKTTSKGKLAPSFTPSVILYNTYKPLMVALEKELGGYLYIRKKHKNQKEQYHLKFSGNPAREVLRNTLPYLRIKAQQAKLALEFPSRAVGRKRGKVNKVGLKQQYKIVSSIKRLNKRGDLSAGNL